MTLKIAFCTDAVVFHQNKILDPNCAKKFPGSEWVYFLSVFAKEYGHEVVTGDIAFTYVQQKVWKASDVLVIQEERALQAEKLISIGGKPFLLLCLESPIYAREFYAHLSTQSKRFKNRILFKGAFNKTSLDGVNHIAYFPSFSEDKIRAIVPWNEKKFLVMVAANKYWKMRRPIHRQLMAWGRDFLLQKRSRLTQDLIDQQLHDKRLELIEFFGKNESLDLYGGGWQDLANLPTTWQKRLNPIIKKLNPLRCDDKHDVLSKYKFAICFENMSSPGYVTEKIIDCIAGGVIPIYLGAPDISFFVPDDLFIDLRGFKNYEDLFTYLNEMTAERAMEIVMKGQIFLKSANGKKFSFESFAKNVLQIIQSP